MKQPLCPVALLFIGGILLGQWVHPSLAILFALSFASALAALVWGRRRTFLLALLLVLAGWTNITRQTTILSPNDLRSRMGREAADVTVRGVLHASPVPRIFERQGRETWHSSVIIDASELRLPDGWRPATGKIIAYLPGVLSSNFFTGQTVEAAGVLAPLPGPRADGLFNARSYYERNRIYYELQTESVAAWSVAPGGPAHRPLSDRFSAWARNTLALGLGPEDAPLRLIWTLALDWKAPLTESVEEPFMRY